MNVALRIPLRFTKMHGAGNDFVVLDRRGDPAPLDPEMEKDALAHALLPSLLYRERAYRGKQ